MIITRKLHVFPLTALIINILLPACAFHRRAAEQTRTQHADLIRTDSRDSLTDDVFRHCQSARTIRLSEFTLSPPDSLGRQHLTRIRLARTDTRTADSLALHRRLTASATASHHALSSSASDSQRDTRTDAPAFLRPAWLLLAVALLVLLNYLLHRKKTPPPA